MLEGINSTGQAFGISRDANTHNESLQDRLLNRPGQPFSLEETFTILAQLGQALAYAHECDVIYGNLRPENILFNDKGDVLLADFFLHALAKQPDNTTPSDDSAYRAPELPPGGTSKEGDQYALGCIAYEMLTGRKPFLIPSINRPGVFYRTKTPIPPKQFTPALPSRSEEAILKAMAKDPAQRHRDIPGFITALGTLTNTRDQMANIGTTSLPLVSDPPEQTHPLPNPVREATEDAETPPTIDLSTPVLTVHSDQTSVPAEAEESPPNESSKPFITSADTLADSLLHSPAQYPFAYNMLTDTTDADPNATSNTSAHAWFSNAESTMRILKQRWVAVGFTCLVAICIVATSVFALSFPRSTPGSKTIPAAGTGIGPTPEHTVTSSSLVPTPQVTATPEPTPTTEPVPMPTATVLPTPTPTPKHGHH
jgi:serine/threonine protein kinase